MGVDGTTPLCVPAVIRTAHGRQEGWESQRVTSLSQLSASTCDGPTHHALTEACVRMSQLQASLGYFQTCSCSRLPEIPAQDLGLLNPFWPTVSSEVLLSTA